jgi:hypothetical protein
MSIANIKDSGNQGNNMPWQWKMLQGIQAIATATSAPLTCVNDSVTICNANIDAFTFTNILGADALNVNIAGGVTLEVNLDAANDQVGIYGYINGASGSPVPLNVNATGQVAIQDGGNSITVDGTVTAVQATASNLNATVVGGTGPQRIATFLRPSGSNGTVGPNIYSASFASVGTANAIVGGINLKPGETLNFDAGAINNTLAAITYNTLTNAGAELIIITLT